MAAPAYRDDWYVDDYVRAENAQGRVERDSTGAAAWLQRTGLDDPVEAAERHLTGTAKRVKVRGLWDPGPTTVTRDQYYAAMQSS